MSKIHISWKQLLIILGAFGLSFAGIVWGVYTNNPTDSGRGGAVAVAFSFLILFLRENYGEDAYKAVTEILPRMHRQIEALGQNKTPPVMDKESDLLKVQLNGIIEKLKGDATEQKEQNVALAIASSIGTCAWGFGDQISPWLKPWLKHYFPNF